MLFDNKRSFDTYQSAFDQELHETKLSYLFRLHVLLQATGENMGITDKKGRILNHGEFVDHFITPIENNEHFLEEYDYANFNDFVKKMRRKSSKRTLKFWKEKGPLSNEYDEKMQNLDYKLRTSDEADLIKRHRWMGKLEGLRQAKEDILGAPYRAALTKRFDIFGLQLTPHDS